MNLRAAMLAPWRASTVSERALAWTLLFVAGALAVGIAVHTRTPKAEVLVTLLMCIGLGPMWLMVMPKTLVLAIDARELRLPTAHREIFLGLWLHGVLCVALPTAILGSLVGMPGMVAATLALACSGCFAIALLPGYQMTLLAVAYLLARFGQMPLAPVGPDAPGFLCWAWPVVVGLILFAGLNWRIALRRGHQRTEPWRLPLASRWLGEARARAPTMPEPTADIRGCGPEAAVRSLRVALGGIHLPQTRRARLRLLLPLFVLIVGLVGLTALRDGRAGDVYQTMLRFGWGNAAFLPWLGVIVSFGIVWIATSQLQRHWDGAERQLLALLPGLYRERSVQHNLVLAALLVPARCLAAVTGVMIMAAVNWHASLALCVALVVVQLALVGQLIAFTLSVLGTPAVSRWTQLSRAMGACVIFAVANLSLLGALSAHVLRSPLGLTLGLLWAVLIVWLVWLGYNGWRTFQARPNPFMSA